MENKFDKDLVDSIINEYFTEEPVEKSMKSDNTADAAVKEAPKAQKDEARNAGRPKQISDVPQEDQDGKREGKYDSDITENEDKEDEPEETKQVSAPSMKKSVSEEEWAEFQAWKEAQAEEEQEVVKSEADETPNFEELIKSQVESLMKSKNEEIEELKKSLNETTELVKAMADTPMPQKSIDNIEYFEKGGKQEKTFSRQEMLDTAFDMALRKSHPDFDDLHVTELENTGTISDPNARRALENELKRRN